MVDVAHDGDDRRARNLRLRYIGFAGETDFDVGVGHALQAVAEFGDEQLGRVGVDGVGDGHHHAHAHERLHHVYGTLGHAVGELLHRDGLGYDDVTHDLLLLH